MIRKLLFFILLLFVCSPSKAVNALTQSCTGFQNSGGSGVASCTLTLGANRLLVLGGASATNGAVFFSDTLGLTFSTIESQNINFPQCGNCILLQGCAITGAGGVDTLSFTLGAFNAGISIIVLEFSGTNNSCTPDGHNSNHGTTTVAATISSGNITTVGATDLTVAFSFTVPNTTTAGAGFTSGPSVGFTWIGNTLTDHAEYNLAAAAGTQAGTYSDPGSDSWEVVFAAFGSGEPKKRNKGQVARYKHRAKPKTVLAKAGARP